MAIVSKREAMSVIGLREPPDLRALKDAYRSQALLWHPDRFFTRRERKAAAARFIQIKEAYDFLKRRTADPEGEPCREGGETHWRQATGTGFERLFFSSGEPGFLLCQCGLLIFWLASMLAVSLPLLG